MKTLQLITLGFLAFMLVGYRVPNADFITNFPVVREKTQNQEQQENHEALYTVKCYDRNGKYTWSVTLLMPENFAQVNQHLYFSNGTNMFAGPMELEKNIKR